MRCPKCHYIAFQDVSECPSCGATLRDDSLSGRPDTDLDLSTGDGSLGPLRDFSLRSPTASTPVSPVPPRRTVPARARRAPLPLFPSASQVGSGRPAARRSARRPLSVRRQTPEVPKFRVSPARSPVRELALRFEVPESDAKGDSSGADAPPAADTALPVRLRLAAGTLDILLLLAIDAAIVYLTSRLAGFPLAGVDQLALVPLLTFLLLLNGGYVVALTVVGGQTVGKMAVGLRVEGVNGSPVTLGRALGRTAAYAVSVLPGGLGCVWLLLGRGRALHDVLADTRVVKVS